MTDIGWTSPIAALKGVGSSFQKKFEQMDIVTLKDLVLHLPSRYEDRTRLYPLSDLKPDQYALIEGEIVDTKVIRRGRRQLILMLAEGTTTVKIVFYHFYPNQEKAYAIGHKVRCYGQVTRIGWMLGMIHPEVEILSKTCTPLVDYLTAVYPTVKGLSQKLWRRCIEGLFSTLQPTLPDGLPSDMLAEKGWPKFYEALQFVHQPPPAVSLNRLEEAQYPAMERLICEELLAHQLSWHQYRMNIVKQGTDSLSLPKSALETFLAKLPFTLTNAQTRVVDEILEDCEKDEPMMRLLQGDVGSGKTVVAAIAALMALASGKKVALMAPTALLVDQHFKNFEQWFEGFDYPVYKLTSLTTTKERKKLHEALNASHPVLLVGTHALIQPEVAMNSLGLVIIDEQHRFGVAQRLRLCEKNQAKPPHQLIMTATPIPRTLVMTYYADMAVSVLDELPKGRQPVKTVVFPAEKRAEIIARIQAVVANGQQVYWVCPLIETSEQLSAQSAVETMEALKKELPHLTIGLVHGKLPPLEKANTMAAFHAGEIQLLVATTVIEVGVDVPNATLMVLENAERLGLAQAHQLRGRVGRGCEQSYCVLLYEGPLSLVARERLSVLRESNDGFVIAEKDLTLRGPGEILGTRQAGGREFKLADLRRDHEHMKAMASLAPRFWAQYPKESQLLISRWCEQRIPFGKV